MKHALSIIFLAIFFYYNLIAQVALLEEMLSAPYATELIKDADGTKVAWVENTAGSLKVYIASAPSYIAREIWSYSPDDGLPVSLKGIDRAGRGIYATIGSGPNREGVTANPAGLAEYPKQILVRFVEDGSRVDTLGDFSNIVLAANGEFGLIARAKSILTINLNTSQISTILTNRGAVSHISLSPDDRSIVFSSNRGGHSFIGHYTLGERYVNWLSPSVDKDMFPCFSPDGTEVVFVRQPGSKKDELPNLTGGVPFEILIHNVRADKSRVIWKSTGDAGGFSQYYPSAPLSWTEAGHILFYSEHEGFMKIYHTNANGITPRAVLSGDCEIEFMDVSPDGSTVVFSSNKDDIDRRDLFVYDLNAARFVERTSSVNIETDPVFLSDGTIVFRESGYNFFTRIARLKLGAMSESAMVMGADPQDRIGAALHVEPVQVTFRAADGTLIHGQLFVKDKTIRQPGVLFMHGGPIRQMLLGYHYGAYYANSYAFNQYLANNGYAVLSVNYRAGIGYGRNFRRAANQGPRGASEYQDIVAAAQYLQQQSYVDPMRIGLWGGSYGGLLTAQGLARNSDIFKAGVDIHGVHDWAWRARDFSPGGGWGIGESDMALAYASSPVADISSWRSPVLIVHGDDDRNVMFGQSVDLVRRLRDRSVDHELLVLPDEIHGFYRYRSWFRIFAASADFFDRKLK